MATKNTTGKTKRSIEAQILALLGQTQFGNTATEITDRLDLSRPTVDKYLKKLAAEKKIFSHAYGRSIVYFVEGVRSARGQASLRQFYLALARGLDQLLHEPNNFSKANPKNALLRLGNLLASNLTLPGDISFPSLEGRPLRYADLQQVAVSLEPWVRHLALDGSKLDYEVIPPLGNSEPRSLLVRLRETIDDPVVLHAHYSLVAGMLEQKLHALTGVSLFLDVSEIKETSVFLELGFIDKYYIDVVVESQRDDSVDPRGFLDRVRDNYLQLFTSNFHEYERDGQLHYYFELVRNEDLEQYMETYGAVLDFNVQLFEELGLDSNRRRLPRAEWPEDPYVVLRYATNFGPLSDYLLETSEKARDHMGYNFAIEKVPEGLEFAFKDSLDFENLYTPGTDREAMEAIYREYGIDNEEYLRRRHENLTRTIREIEERKRRRRREERARRRKARKEKTRKEKTRKEKTQK